MITDLSALLVTEVAASLQLQLPEFESSCIFGVCTSAGSHFCIPLTRRDNLASDHQPLEHGAHARPSERTRATPQTVAQPRQGSIQRAYPHRPSVHHRIISRVLLFLPVTLLAVLRRVRPPPLIGQSVDWMWDHREQLERRVRQPARGKP